jgi:thioredoxin-like negative regulator of GroEL
MPDLSPRVATGLLAAAALAAGLPARAAESAAVQWRTDYNAARKEAQEKRLPLLLEIGSDDCTHCRRQDATTFRDPAVIALLNSQFIPLRVDGNKEATLTQALRIQVYPTTVIAAADGKVLGFLQGYVSADQLREQARRVVPSADPPRPFRSQELLAAAREDFQAKRYADCLDKCELITAQFTDLSEGKQAAALAAEVKGDPERLATASDQLDERAATLYLTLADAWQKKGKPREAEAYLEKAVRVRPVGKLAELARTRLASLRRGDAEPASPES